MLGKLINSLYWTLSTIGLYLSLWNQTTFANVFLTFVGTTGLGRNWMLKQLFGIVVCIAYWGGCLCLGLLQRAPNGPTCNLKQRYMCCGW
ncbi:hypothetical protein BC941DRAFT_421376 [Chlamydoabsidia padenii]|nr:hypothetical protein BC941DRAFT_421376 [Chlamydoabsidia padenii]